MANLEADEILERYISLCALADTADETDEYVRWQHKADAVAEAHPWVATFPLVDALIAQKRREYEQRGDR